MDDDAVFSFEAVDALIKRRIDSWKYLKKVHEGSLHWMNVVFLSKEEIFSHCDAKVLQKRAEEWFYLGVSLGPLLKLSGGEPFVRALVQLLDEFETYVKSGKVFRSRESAAKAEFLVAPNVPSALDYIQIVLTLCELLVLIYSKLIDPTVDSKSLGKEFYSLLIKADGRFKQEVVSPISKDLNNTALALLRSQLSSLDTLYNSKV